MKKPKQPNLTKSHMPGMTCGQAGLEVGTKKYRYALHFPLPFPFPPLATPPLLTRHHLPSPSLRSRPLKSS